VLVQEEEEMSRDSNCNPTPEVTSTRQRTAPVILALLASCIFGSTAGAQVTRVSAFGLDKYVSSGECSEGDIFGKQSAVGFQNSITAPGGQLTWTIGVTRVDQEVSGQNLADPTWSGRPADRDQKASSGLDAPNTAISYLAGHGSNAGGNAFDETQPCTSASQCTNPKGITHMPSRCAQDPRSPGTASCLYEYPHAFIACGTGDSDLTDRVDYSSGATNPGVPREMRVGESATSGSWGQAGIDGGVNVLVLESSHSSHIGSGVNDLIGLFAGVQVLLTSFTHYGDLTNGAERGQDFGALAWMSPSMAVSDAWVAVTGMLSLGSGCGSYPGFADGGFNGCGGHVAMVVDSTAAGRTAAMDFTFTAIRSNANDSAGNGFWATRKTYNWDDDQVPPLL
jgi:hypothetical protein